MLGYCNLNLDFRLICVCKKMMELNLEQLTPPMRLALAYAKRPERDALALMLMFDVSLSRIVQRSSEPLIGQMRLAWWRDVISKPINARPSGEPLIGQLGVLQQKHQGWAVDQHMLLIVRGWDVLLAHEERGDTVLKQHTEARARGIFSGFADIANAPDQEGHRAFEIGVKWATVEARQYFDGDSMAPEQNDITDIRLSRPLRPLSVLALSNDPAMSSARLFWHALTGR